MLPHRPSLKTPSAGLTSRAALRALPVLLCLWAGCAQPTSEQASRAQAAGPTVTVGVPGQGSLQAEPAGRRAALEAWSTQSDEAGALALARAYFPEFDEEGPRGPLPEEAALRVEFASRESGALRLATRGLLFTVRPLEGGAAPVSRSGPGATFYGPRHFFTLVGAQGRRPTEASGAALASRVEEFEVLDAGQASWHARYEVALPAGVTAVRDARGHLEFLDAGGTPVLRMHYPLARDSAGVGRQGQVRLEGLREGALPSSDGLAVYALAGPSLRVEMALELSGLQGPVVVDPGWSATAALAEPRSQHTSTLLGNGRVLVTGGLGAGGTALSSAEVYDVDSNTWRATAPLAGARSRHTATLLPGGRVLVAGGLEGTTALASAELYDVASGTFSATGSLAAARRQHTATLLPDGRLLLAGGLGSGDTALASAELYDSATGQWSTTGALAHARAWHTATALPGGRVLVAGGTGAEPLSSAELYEAASGTWSAAAPLGQAHSHHSSTLLFDGRVLVAGGQGPGGALAAAQLYDVATNAWSPAPALPEARTRHSATLLPGGQVVVAGGRNDTGLVGTTQVYDVAAGSWSAGGALPAPVVGHTATLLPTGQVLLAGGELSGGAPASQVGLYDAEALRRRAAGSMASARQFATTMPLPDGRVLVVGGFAAGVTLSSAELYEPATDTWSATGSLSIARAGHTATLLPDGRVLVAGGTETVNNTGSSLPVTGAELYDPATGTWSPAGAMRLARLQHTATLLPNGKVLVAGGLDGSGVARREAELYEPSTNTWSDAASMASARGIHNAVRLHGGQVLVAGGSSNDKLDGTAVYPTGAELYDAASNAWRSAGTIASGRRYATLTLLASGKALLAGGVAANYLRGAELYDPAVSGWSSTSSALHEHSGGAATLLPDGKVLLAGGQSSSGVSNLAELYDPATGLWKATVGLLEARNLHGCVPLSDGRVLLMGGGSTSGALASAELYELPRALTGTPTLSGPDTLGQGRFTVSGSGLLGLSEAGHGATQGSAANVPLATLRPLDSSGFRRLAGAGFSATSLEVDVPDLPEGYYVLSVTTQGLSAGRVVRMDRTPPEVPGVELPPSAPPFNTNTPTFSGTTEPGATVTLYVDGTAVAVTRADSTGAWSVTLPTPLSDGTHTLSVSATDEANNTSLPTTEVSFSVDSTPPAAPVVEAPANGAFVNTQRPLLSGSAEAGSTVTLTLDGGPLATTTADSTGSWSVQTLANLPDDTYALTATATDAAGNTSAPSSVSFTVDTMAPAPPLLTAPTAGQSLRQARPTFLGTAEPGGTVSVLIDGTVAGQASTTLDGTWSFTAPVDLSDGSHTVAASTTDAAGNASTPSDNVSFTVDTVPPAAPVLTSPAGGAALASVRPVFSGTAEPLSTVLLRIDGTPAGGTTADTSGAWSLTAPEPLSEGPHAASATATDAAGNTSVASAPVSFGVDTLAPEAPVVRSPAAGATLDTPRPTFSGTAEPGSTVTLWVDDVQVGTVVAEPSGQWSFTLTSDLAEGTHTARASATDAAGNTSATSTVSVRVVLPAPQPQPQPQPQPPPVSVDEPGSCGCASTSAGGGWLWGLVLLGLRGPRGRRPRPPTSRAG